MASAQRYQRESRFEASAQARASASDTAPLVALTTDGGAGVESVRFAGGTLFTPYGAHNAAHAAGTWSIAVVVRTDEHGPAAALGRGRAVGVVLAVAVTDGAGVPHDDRARAATVAPMPPRKQPVHMIPCPSSNSGFATASSARRPGSTQRHKSREPVLDFQSRGRYARAIGSARRCAAVTRLQLASGSNRSAPVASGSRARCRPPGRRYHPRR